MGLKFKSMINLGNVQTINYSLIKFFEKQGQTPEQFKEKIGKMKDFCAE